MTQNKGITFKTTHQFLKVLFSRDVHAKRIYSLANATLGVISTASLAVNTIGQGLALARGRLPKHTIKQVDRLLSNAGINVDELSERWVPYVIGQRPHIIVAMDWTDFDADDHATIMLSLISKHGRSTPLVWLTVDKATLKNHRNAYEYRVLVQLAEVVPGCQSLDRGGSWVRRSKVVSGSDRRAEIRLSDTVPRQYRRDLS